MALKTFTMHLYARESLDFLGEKGEVVYKLAAWPDMEGMGAYIGPVEVQAEVPDFFDVRTARIKAKEQELNRVRAEFQARITQIQREINELQAIEMEA